MFINELPEECLLIIFGLLNELDDLLNCYKVCNKWSHLIVERTRKVKYLVAHQDNWRDYVRYETKKPHDETYSRPFPSYPFDYVYYLTEEPIDVTCLSSLFPNLKIAEFSYGFFKKVKHEDIVTLVKKMKPLKGLIHEFYSIDEPIFKYCDELEMVSTDYIEPCMEKNGVNVKQLHLWRFTLHLFKEYAHYFPNIERLYIYNNESSPDPYYNGPILKKLKMVELSLSSYNGEDIYYGFQFMDSCPNLQSAHIYLNSNRIFVDESSKHRSLQDLVLEFDISDYYDSVDWNELKRLFMKYPNLKHLALWSNRSLENGHVEQLVRMLPKLVLFDVRGCPKVTHDAVNLVQDYCELHGRSIKFYFDENYDAIRSDWLQLSTRCESISQGFDFMKHCFLKGFRNLSAFLVPNED